MTLKMAVAMVAIAASVTARAAPDEPQIHHWRASSGARQCARSARPCGVGDTLYVAGHLGIDPKTGQVPQDPALEAKLVLDAVKATVERAGATMDDFVSVTVYCTDLVSMTRSILCTRRTSTRTIRRVHSWVLRRCCVAGTSRCRGLPSSGTRRAANRPPRGHRRRGASNDAAIARRGSGPSEHNVVTGGRAASGLTVARCRSSAMSNRIPRNGDRA